MNRTLSTDYRAVNAKGVTLYTFNDEGRGRAWVRDNACLHDGLRLVAVTLTETSRRIYTPRTAKPKRDAFAIPAFDGVHA